MAQHHERWDGNGYPDGLKCEEISEFARIIAVADTYHELASVKSNRRALMPHEAIEFIMAYSGDMFDPKLVHLRAESRPLRQASRTNLLRQGPKGGVEAL